MTIQNNLFIDSPEIEDISMTRLGKDSNEWSEEIITKLKERVPATGHLSLSVKFMHQDDEVGAATGSVTVTNGKKAMVVPVVIKDFSMYPLDICLFEGKILPLNSESFAQIFSDGSESAFGSLLEYPLMSMVDRYMRGENLQNVVFPPNWGRYAFASEVDKSLSDASMLQEIQGTVDGGPVMQKVRDNAGDLGRFYANGMLDILKNMSNLKTVNMSEFRQSVDDLVMRTIHVLKKDGPNRYTLLSTANNTFNPAFTTLDRYGMQSFCSKAGVKHESMHDIDQNGEKIISIIDDTQNTLFLAKPEKQNAEPINTFGRYMCRGKTGVNVEGIVVTNVVDFDQKLLPTKLFLGKTNSTMQAKIVGSKLTTSDWFPQGSYPSVGQTGTFFYHEDDKGGVATVPVTIKKIWSDGCGVQIRAVDLSGQDLKLCLSDDSKHNIERQQITRMPTDMNDAVPSFCIPGGMKWVPMCGFDDLADSVLVFNMHTEINNTPNNLLNLLHTGYDQYSLQGADKYVEKMGWDKTALDSAQAKFLLAALGASETKVASFVQEAKRHGSVKLAATSLPQLWEEKIAAHMPEALTMQKTAAQFKCDLIKVASYLENAQTVDSLLSLNFVNPDNLSKFVSKIPLFKACISHLASCLLASRLGIREIPEQSASSAMAKVVDVVRGLEALRATQSVTRKV